MAADLHVHSNFSDGTETPHEIIKTGKTIGLKAISITDHDTVSGTAAAVNAGEEFKIQVIPGLEFSTLEGKSEMHILGYFIDYKNEELLDKLKDKQSGRKKRIIKIVNKLRELKIDISPEAVFAAAKNESPGRPHVAKVLLEAGIVSNLKEAFNRFLANGAAAYVPHFKLSPKDAIAIIKKAGGMAVLAHPGMYNLEGFIPGLAAEGLAGIEVYYPAHSEETVEKYLGLAKKFGLLVTGGSDYHGANSGRDVVLACAVLGDEDLEKLNNEHLRGN